MALAGQIDLSAGAAALETYAANAGSWLNTLVAQATAPGTLWQLLAIAVILVVAVFAGRYPTGRLTALSDRHVGVAVLHSLYRSLARICWPAIAVLLLWIVALAWNALGQPAHALRIAMSLLGAWIAIQLVAANLGSEFWSRMFAVVAWTISALYILQLLDDVAELLDASAITIGEARISALSVLTSIVVVVLALWIGRVAGDAVQSRLRGAPHLNPSMAGLLGQVAKAGLMIVAVLIALNAVGFNLTALTVFTGALGVGIGFGLQSVFSNFISGVIILMERSIKVGDFIELQSGVNGLVKEINIRSTLVTTNDNVDILVPNEEFIKAQVINWTLRESLRRYRIPFGVAYGTDKELVRKAGLEAAAACEWTFDDGAARSPQVWLVNFGDSSLDFELVVWLTEEAVKRPARIKADYYWEIHTVLEKYDIEIPFPQRDLHVRSDFRAAKEAEANA